MHSERIHSDSVGNSPADRAGEVRCSHDFAGHSGGQGARPAATSTLSVLLNYPGLKAIRCAPSSRTGCTRTASSSSRARCRQWTRHRTGIEIHPGATIGDALLHRPRHGRRHRRDDRHRRRRHALPGRHARRHRQGARQAPPDARGLRRRRRRRDRPRRHHHRPRHAGSAAGPSSSTTCPPNCTVVGVPGRIVVREGQRVETVDLHHEDLPDPVVEMFRCMQRRIDRLEARLSAAERRREAEREDEDAPAAVRAGDTCDFGGPDGDPAP